MIESITPVPSIRAKTCRASSRPRPEKSDAIKRQALHEAGIALIELPTKFDRKTVAGLIKTLTTQDDKEEQRMGVRR